MKRKPSAKTATPMNAEEYAGFLELWLSPPSRLPRNSPRLEAYLRYSNEREPLSEAASLAIGKPTKQAA